METPEPMNIDQLMARMKADEDADQEWCTPIQYAKVRPVQAPQVYGWIRTGKITWKHCECGRKVINVQEVDDLLRSKGKLPPALEKDNDGEEPDIDTDSEDS